MKDKIESLKEGLIDALTKRVQSEEATAADFKEARETVKAFEGDGKVLPLGALHEARAATAPFTIRGDRLGSSEYRKTLQSKETS
jgi:hypothetical protein